jgi:hypothetical protein
VVPSPTFSADQTYAAWERLAVVAGCSRDALASWVAIAMQTLAYPGDAGEFCDEIELQLHEQAQCSDGIRRATQGRRRFIL